MQSCCFCNQNVDKSIDILVHRDIYSPFCSGSCAISFCKYNIGLLGIEQQMKYLVEHHKIPFEDLKLIKPEEFKHINPIQQEERVSQQTSSEHNQKTVGIYEKFLQERIGTNFGSDFFSLDSLIS